MHRMKAHPEWLRAGFVGRPVGVDREAKVLRGMVVAQAGPFKSAGRGEFDGQSLDKIVQLGNAAKGGLKSRFTHPDMSSDGLGTFLGRLHGFGQGMATDADGKAVAAVRADLHFDPSAFATPNGDLATYVMDLAASDPDALSSSLVLKRDEEYRLNLDGTKQCDDEGEPLPPLWRPTRLHAADLVDTGDAVDGLLSAGGVEIDADGLPLAALWRGAELLDGVFAGQARDVVEARCRAWLDRYLERRYGPADGALAANPTMTPTDVLRRRLELLKKNS